MTRPQIQAQLTMTRPQILAPLTEMLKLLIWMS
jgi:hypothetical protein